MARKVSSVALRPFALGDVGPSFRTRSVRRTLALSCKGRGRERPRGPCQLQRVVRPHPLSEGRLFAASVLVPLQRRPLALHETLSINDRISWAAHCRSAAPCARSQAWRGTWPSTAGAVTRRVCVADCKKREKLGRRRMSEVSSRVTWTSSEVSSMSFVGGVGLTPRSAASGDLMKARAARQ